MQRFNWQNAPKKEYKRKGKTDQREMSTARLSIHIT